MRRRKHCPQTMKNKSYQGQFLKDGQTDHQYKQSCLQLPSQHYDAYPGYKNLSVWTVENPMTSKVNDSEPFYQTIEEIVKNNSDVVDDSHDICEEKQGQKMIFSTMNTFNHKKRNILYGIITAKEIAKYKPCTQDIVRR